MSKTILQIIPSLNSGGAEQACVDIAVALQARGDKAIVVSAGGKKVQILEAHGITHLLLPSAGAKNPFYIYQNARFLCRIIRAYNVGCVHARSRAPAWAAFFACQKMHVPFITTFHAAYKFQSVLKKFYNSVMARGDRVIAISQYIARHVVEHYGVLPDRLRVVLRGIDCEAFNPAAVSEERKSALAQIWNVPHGRKIILLPSRPSPIKGHSILLKAFADLPMVQKQKAHIVFLGREAAKPTYVQELENLVRHEGLGEHITFAPECSDMPAAMCLADIVVMPSVVPEGFGRVPVEAMAMGKCVLASTLGAASETIIPAKTGWLISPQDIPGWTSALTHALSLTPEANSVLSFAASERVRALFDVRQMVAKTLDVYDEVL